MGPGREQLAQSLPGKVMGPTNVGAPSLHMFAIRSAPSPQQRAPSSPRAGPICQIIVFFLLPLRNEK